MKKSNVPQHFFTNDERIGGILNAAAQQNILDAFKKEGAILLGNVLDKQFVTKLYDYYMLNYQDINTSPINSSYKLDHERYFVVPRITSLFNDERFYNNPIITQLLTLIIGSSWKYQSITSVLSYPDSKAQGIHIDAPLLFHSESISKILPVYALTVVIPLVDIDDENGGTRVWLGSHMDPHTKNGELQKDDIRLSESVVMQAKRGDCFLMDYRLTHAGEPNNSQSPRPIITMICALPWFNDNINYEHIPEIIMTPEDIQIMPKESQKRFNMPKFLNYYTDIGNKINSTRTEDDNENVSRNDPCPCGSGLRYKKCHGHL
ncbi:MAG: phytanoyl-CoA dioxygenase family protein [Pseudomonadota bacterium]